MSTNFPHPLDQQSWGLAHSRVILLFVKFLKVLLFFKKFIAKEEHKKSRHVIGSEKMIL